MCSILTPDQPPYQKTLPDGLSLRTVSTPCDLEHVCQLSTAVHGEATVGGMTAKLFGAHPDTTGRDLAFIEDSTGAALATLCLVPWTLRFCGVDLPVGELAIVGTLERCRKQGLNRQLMDYFWQRFAERGCLLSIIQGIPNYYRRFGYEYARLPLIGGLRLQADQLPNAPADGFTVRPANIADIPTLARLYDAHAAGLDISARRTPAVWEYLINPGPVPEEGLHDTFLVLSPAGAPAGYFRVPVYHFNPNLLCVDEVSELAYPAALAVLRHCAKLAEAREKDGIRLQLPLGSGLARLAKACGAVDMGSYSWQVFIPDPAALLRALAPVFEQRLAGSLFAGLSGAFGLNLYQEVLGLTFAGGRLTDVCRSPTGAVDLLSLPAAQFTPLVLGGSSLDEIHALFPDAFAHGHWSLLVDTLFPKTRGYLYNIY
jgi:GNAT superfamily N-acetyltransferase